MRNPRNVLVTSLAGDECPSCHARKRRGFAFCVRCSGLLPKPMRDGLSSRIGHGYEEAHADAMQRLGRVPIFETSGGGS